MARVDRETMASRVRQMLPLIIDDAVAMAAAAEAPNGDARFEYARSAMRTHMLALVAALDARPGLPALPAQPKEVSR